MAATALWAARPAVNSVWGIGVVSVFVHCAVDYPTQKPALAAFFFFMLGLLAASRETAPQQNRQKMVDIARPV